MTSLWCHQMCMNEKVNQGPLYDIDVWCNRSLETKLHPIVVRQYGHLKCVCVSWVLPLQSVWNFLTCLKSLTWTQWHNRWGIVPPLETSDWEFCWPTGKKSKGKGGKQRRKIVKRKVENWKWKEERYKMRRGPFFFFYYYYLFILFIYLFFYLFYYYFFFFSFCLSKTWVHSGGGGGGGTWMSRRGIRLVQKFTWKGPFFTIEHCRCLTWIGYQIHIKLV